MAGDDLIGKGIIPPSSSGGGGGDPVANEDLGEFIKKTLDRAPDKAVKVLGAIPIIGPLLASLVPFNAGEVGLVKDQPGFLAGKINRGAESINVRGGTIATALGGVVKRSEITDLVGSGIEKPVIEGIAISGLDMGSASFGDLGSLIPGPPGLPNNMGGIGMGMNA